MIEQFKTLDDLDELIKQYEVILMRPTLKLSHPTLYRLRDAGKKEIIIKGVRVKDWCLSEDHKWVKPHNQMGLSFSATLKNLSAVYKTKQRYNPTKTINIYWVLEGADIPSGLKFVADQDSPEHYYLTATERMPLSTLIQKLKLVAQRMTVIRNAGKVL
ncbi:MAG: hypothetical protein V4732_06530 [Pseudomonadota bacterium]